MTVGGHSFWRNHDVNPWFSRQSDRMFQAMFEDSGEQIAHDPVTTAVRFGQSGSGQDEHSQNVTECTHCSLGANSSSHASCIG